ncbi:MAG: DUF4129 domain-containing protein [Hungatella sp.]|nr:DUF4129 domain-containing protein [Hungatella sp.]
MTIRKLLNYWLSKKRSEFYVFGGLLLGGVYVVGAMLNGSRSALLKQIGFFGLLILIPAHFIHANLHAGHWFLDHFKDTDHVPRRQIAYVNSFCMTFFLGVSILAMPAAAYVTEPLWQAIFLWFSRRSHPERAVYPALNMDMKPASPPDMTKIFGEPKPTPAWIQVLDQVFYVLGAILVMILFFMMVKGICRKVWAWITRPRHFDDDEKIYLTPAWTLPSGKREKAGRTSRLWFSSYSGRIRRMYQKEILAGAKKTKVSPSPWASPRELEKAAGVEHPVLHELYEKARYGPEGCSKEDWGRLRG